MVRPARILVNTTVSAPGRAATMVDRLNTHRMVDLYLNSTFVKRRARFPTMTNFVDRTNRAGDNLDILHGLHYASVRRRQNEHVLFGQQEDRCNGCRSESPVRNHTVARIIRESRGGTDHIENPHLLCGHRNRVKGDRP